MQIYLISTACVPENLACYVLLQALAMQIDGRLNDHNDTM